MRKYARLQPLATTQWSNDWHMSVVGPKPRTMPSAPFQVAEESLPGDLGVPHALTPRKRGMRQRLPAGLLVAVLAVAAMTWVRMSLSGVLNTSTPYITFFLAVMIAAWYGGLWSALLALALSTLSAAYFFIPPLHSFQILDASSLVSLAVFVIVSLLISLLAESQRAAARRSQQQQLELELQTNARLQSEQAIRLQNRQLQTGNMGVWQWDIPSGNVSWSGGLAAIHGIEPGSLGGTFEEFQRDTHPDDRAAVAAAMQRVVAEGGEFHAEYRIVRPDGRMVWVEARGSLERDVRGVPQRMSGLCADITERKRTEESLRDSEAQYRASFELAAVGKAQTDVETGRFTRVNRRLCQITGYSEQELLGMVFSQITHPDDRQPDFADWQRMVHGETSEHSIEKRYIRKNGEIAWVNVTGTVVRDGEGRPLRGISVIQDVTGRKKAEAELIVHRERLEELVAQRTHELQDSHQKLRLSERMAALGTLSAGLGHDMGNLLLPLRLRLDSMEAKGVPANNREDLEAIRKCAEYLQRLANGLRLFALDPEASDGGTERTDLNEWWPDVFSFFKNALPRHVSLECRFDPALPPVRMARPNLTQAIFNLVQNAGEVFKDRESGEVVVWAERGADTHTMRIGVSDDGPGMTPEVRQRCLEPFFTTKTRGISTGLGLALVHGIVQKAGGIVEINTELGRGTTFILTLPAGTDADLEAASRAQRPMAVISLHDDRIRAYVTSVMQAMAFHVVLGDQPTHADAMLWMTDPSERVLEKAQAFMKERPGRRVVIFGKVSGDGAALKNGILEFGDAPNPAAIRQTLREMALEFGFREGGTIAPS